LLIIESIPMKTSSPAAAEVARQVNAQIREIAESLAIQGDEGHKYTFFCECGCLQALERTLEEVARDGFALAEGHLPEDAASAEDEELPTPLEAAS
jgi:hypothetical protein